MKILGNVRSISKKFYFGRLSLCPNKHCNFSSLTQIKIPYSLSRDITFSNNEINDNIKNIEINKENDSDNKENNNLNLIMNNNQFYLSKEKLIQLQYERKLTFSKTYLNNNLSNNSHFNKKIFTINNRNREFNLINLLSKHFSILRETERVNQTKVEKVKQKFMDTSKQNSKLLLIEKNIITTLDKNISPEIKNELDGGLKIISEIEKEEKVPVSKIDAYYYMKSIDPKFESFFHNREFNIKNFNYYMQVLSSQFKIKEMEENIVKMEEMGIKPNNNTYIILLNSYAKAKNIEECERVFSILKKRTKDKTNIYSYNSLLLAYAKNGLVNQAESIINEMLKKGLEPDSACYTTLILAYKKIGDYGKCWEIYEDCQFKGNVDEFMISYMIKIAGLCKNPEKALLLYEYFELQGFNHYTINFNSLLFALSSTKKYAEKTLEVFQKMKMKNVIPDSYTYVCVLRATAHLGDINTANEIIKEMKLMDLPMNEYICNGLIRTFGGAAKIPYVKLEHLDEYLKDCWNIFHFMEKNDIRISVQILDSLLEVHCLMHKMEDVDGLVLPLYEKYGYEFTVHTYEKLCQMLFDLRKFDRIIKIYETLLKKSEEKNYYELSDRILNTVLETGIRTNDCDLIVSSLKNFGNINGKPIKHLLRNLASIDNLPDSLFVELRKWVDTEKLGRKLRAFSPPQIREKSITPTPNNRRRGKRIK